MPEALDQEVVGTIGVISVPIKRGKPGEVLLPIRGGTEAYSALCDQNVAKHARVVVVEILTGRTVIVTPC